MSRLPPRVHVIEDVRRRGRNLPGRPVLFRRHVCGSPGMGAYTRARNEEGRRRHGDQVRQPRTSPARTGSG